MSNFLLQHPDCVLIHIPKPAGSRFRKGAWQGRIETPAHSSTPEDRQRFRSFVWKLVTPGTCNQPNWSPPAEARPLTLVEFAEIFFYESIPFDEPRRSSEEEILHHSMPASHPLYCSSDAEFVGRFKFTERDHTMVENRLGLQPYWAHRHAPAHGRSKNHLWGPDQECCKAFSAEDVRELGY